MILTIVSYYLASKGQINHIPTYFAGALFLVLAITSWRDVVAPMPSAALVAALTVYLALTPLWNGGGLETTALRAGHALLLVAFVFGIPTVAARFDGFLDWLLTLLILSAVVSATYSIYFYHALDYNPLDEKDRLYGLGRLANPAVSGMSYSVALIPAAHRVLFRRGLERIVWGTAVAVLLYALWLTGTRSMWIGLGATMTVAALACGNATLRNRALMLPGTLILLAAGITLAFNVDREQFLRRADSFRPEIWTGVVDKALDGNWFFGNGINTSSATQFRDIVFDHAHSIYVGTFYYGGVVGLLLLLALLVITYRHLLTRPHSELRDLALMMLTFGAVTLALDGDQLLEKVDYPWLVFWLPVALALCVSTRNQLLEEPEGLDRGGVP